MMFWIIAGLVAVALVALGWWTSGRKSSALGVDGSAHQSMKADAQFEAHRHQQSGPGGGGAGGF